MKCRNCLAIKLEGICQDCVQARLLFHRFLILKASIPENKLQVERSLQNQGKSKTEKRSHESIEMTLKLQALRKRVGEKRAMVEKGTRVINLKLMQNNAKRLLLAQRSQIALFLKKFKQSTEAELLCEKGKSEEVAESLKNAQSTLIKELSIAIDLKLLDNFDLKAHRKNNAIAGAQTQDILATGGLKQLRSLIHNDHLNSDPHQGLSILGHVWVDDVPWIETPVEDCNALISVVVRCTRVAFEYMDVRLPFKTFQSDNQYYITPSWSKRRSKFPLFVGEGYTNMAEFLVGFAMLICNTLYASNRLGMRIQQSNLGSIAKNLQKLLSVYVNSSFRPRSRFSFLADFNVLINQAARIIYGGAWDNHVNALGVYHILLEESIWKDVDCSFIDDSWDFV